MSTQDNCGYSALHRDSNGGHFRSIKCLLGLLPEESRLQVVCLRNKSGNTALHEGAFSKAVEIILELLPASQRSDAVSVKNDRGETVMNLWGLVKRDSILELLSESESSIRKRSRDSVLETEETHPPECQPNDHFESPGHDA